MKFIPAFTLLTLISSIAFANPPVKPGVSLVPANLALASNSGAELGTTPKVNPFTGVPTSFEDTQKRLELMRAQTQLLEEQLKQAGLAMDLKQLPQKKALESKQRSAGNLAASGYSGVGSVNTVSLPPDLLPGQGFSDDLPRSSSTSRKYKSSTQKKQVKPTVVQSAPAVASAPVLRIVGMLDVGNGRGAVIAQGDTNVVVKLGEQTPFGLVTSITDNAVKIGNMTLSYDNTSISKITISDRVEGGIGRPQGTGPFSSTSVTKQQATLAGSTVAPNIVLPAPPSLRY